MPELPEVETIVREMAEVNLVGSVIDSAKVYWPRTIEILAPDDFCKLISGQTIKNIGRRGKFLVFTLTKNILLVHLRMTGKFFLVDFKTSPTSHERVRLIFTDGRALRFEDQRKFGRWYLISPEDITKLKLGLEPLSSEFTLKAFKNCIKGHTAQIKPFLLNQRYIAGLGNIYVDEVLWEAKIHPKTPLNYLTKEDVTSLYHAIPIILYRGISNMGTTLGSHQANYFSVSGRRGSNQHQLRVFRQEGHPCPRCKTTIIKIIVAQRGTHLCPKCQVFK